MKRLILFPFLGLLILLIACGGGQPEMVEVTRVTSETETIETVEEEPAAEDSVLARSNPDTAAAYSTPAGTPTADTGRGNERQQTRQRLIIKNGQMTVETETAGDAVSAVANLAAATGGYIISQRVWDQNGYTYATMEIGVPVREFERAMDSIRQLGQVTQDIASGEDVTDEFVDLGSRLETLEITQERLQTFLADAKKMEDIIALNNELTKVEEQINVIRGRMNYLRDRAAFSTITVQINPIIPEPTPTPTLTPTPIPDPEPWSVGTTATTATRRLQNSTRSVVDFLVYNTIVCGPWLFLIGLGAYFALRMWLRMQGRPPYIMNAPRRQNRENTEQES